MSPSPASSRTGGGALTLLSTTTLVAPGTFDEQSISTAYTDLVCVLMVRGAAAAASDQLVMRVNNDSGGNYDIQTINGSGAATGAAEVFADTGINDVHVIAADSADAGLFTYVEVTIPGYASTTWTKVFNMFFASKVGTASGNMRARHSTAFWRSTAAINRVGFFGNATANLVTGSQLRIYGRS